MGIRPASILAGEICNFFGNGRCGARLHFRDDGMGISAENEVGKGGICEVPFTG